MLYADYTAEYSQFEIITAPLSTKLKLLLITKNVALFKEINSNGLAVIASCSLDMEPKLDCQISIIANKNSSFNFRIPILTKDS